jgi:hypothetical protein
MRTFPQRFVGAAKLKPTVYEEVEADKNATGQALGVVVLSSVATGIGFFGAVGTGLIAVTIGAVVRWFLWAVLVQVLGVRVFAQPQTRSDVGELLRTTGFAAAPSVLRVFALVPVLGVLVVFVAEVWTLAAMVVAVRQALDFTSTWRAAAVCVTGWAATLVIVVLLGALLMPPVQ